MAKSNDKVIAVYNLARIGVDVDTDNLHVPNGTFRQAQNIHRNPTSQTTESIISREGMRNLNQIALGLGAVLGGIAIPAFEVGDGVSYMFLGFGD